MSRRMVLFTLCMACLLMMGGCQKKTSSDVAVFGGETYVVDTEKQTITHGETVYHYQVTGDSTEIVYPNGATYWWQQNGNSGAGGYSENYSETQYDPGRVLIDALYERNGGASLREPRNVVLIFFLIVIGVFNAVWPKTAWYLGYGWRFKDAEPSEAALSLTRVGGIIAAVIGIAMMVV